MNKALLLSTLKSNLQFIGICTVILILYATAIISMFNPGDAQANQKLLESLPPDFAKALGLQGLEPWLTSFLATSMYSIPYVLFMAIFVVVIANGLMARKVDRGSMAFYLATSVSRARVALTQGSALIVSQVIIGVTLTLVSILVSIARFGNGALNAGAFLQLNLIGFCLFFVIGAFSFLSSSLFNEEKYSLACSAGLIVLLYALNAIGNLSGKQPWLNSINLFGAFNPAKIVGGSEGILAPILVFVPVGILLYGIAAIVFNKRNLPL